MISSSDKLVYDAILDCGAIGKDVLDQQLKKADGAQTSFAELLLSTGLLEEGDILQSVSKKYNIPVISLTPDQVDANAVKKVPARLAHFYRLIPLKITGRKLVVAVARPLDIGTIDEMRLNLGYEISYVLASLREINETVAFHYGVGADTVEKILAQDSSSGSGQALTIDRSVHVEDIEKLADNASVVQLVNKIILEAYQKRASDIHLEPFRDRVRIRYRIDGLLHETRVPPEMKNFFTAILSRVKIMANLNIVERRLPQDGKARVKVQSQTIDLRISVIPTPFGESMVIRILPGQMIMKPEQLGFEQDHQNLFMNLIMAPHGIVFLTGPTGSGKSTTLYAALNVLNEIERKIITIEDPIEYELPGVTQIQIAPEVGLTFGSGLRSMLRHDPDVMMVGEVRDLETADIAIRVALTGHLVLSTLHTNDAASGVTRLLDIGVQPYLIASSVNAFIAQRLVRLICWSCRVDDKNQMPGIEKMIRNELNLKSSDPVKISKGKGCDQCNGTGFRGRVALHEILIMNSVIRRLVVNKASTEEILRASRANYMRMLRQDGWMKVLKGLTTPDEVMEATPPVPRNEGRDGSGTHDSARALIQAVPLESHYDGEERRKFKRVTIDRPASYRIVVPYGHPHKHETTDQWIKTARMESVSANGASLLVKDKIEADDVLEVLVMLNEKEKPLQFIAKIIRVLDIETGRYKDAGYQFEAAITFLAINSSDRAGLENFCNPRGA